MKTNLRLEELLALYLFGLAIILIGIEIVSNIIRRGNIYLRPSINNIFYPLEFSADKSSQIKPERGYIRRLNLKTAMMLCDHEIPKHTEISMHLGCLPGFPKRDAWVSATVKACEMISPTHYNVWLSLHDHDTAETTLLRSYIVSLLPNHHAA